MQIFQNFLKHSAKTDLGHHVCTTQIDDPVMKYLLATLATEEMIAAVDAQTTNLQQPEHITAIKYPKFCGKHITLQSCQ